MDSEVQDNKTCSKCSWYIDEEGGSMGICSALYYDLSFGNRAACEHFKEAEECKNIKPEQ